MGAALYSVFQLVLPSSDCFVCSQIEAVGNDSNKGFELLWLLQKRYITMFDLTKEPTWPEWHDDIFRFAKRVLMHCNLSRYLNTIYLSTHCSLLFLQSLQGHYKDIGNTYVLMILAHHQSEGDTAELPTHLCILALAQTLAGANFGGTPRELNADTGACRISTTEDMGPLGLDTPTVHTQGCVAMKAKLRQHRTGNSHGPRGHPKAAPDAALSDCRQKAAPHHSWYQGTCNACGQWGHPANACDKVGVWAFLWQYHWDCANATAIQAAERAWVEKNKPFLRDRADTPRKVFSTYCDRMGITKDQVINKINRDFFANNEANV